MTTPNLGLDEMPSNSLEPSVPFNNNQQLLDAITQLVIEDKDLTAPPTTLEADIGKVWIVGASATGAWSGHDDELALCTGADLWRFITAKVGWRGYVADEDVDYRLGGGGWVSLGV